MEIKVQPFFSPLLIYDITDVRWANRAAERQQGTQQELFAFWIDPKKYF